MYKNYIQLDFIVTKIAEKDSFIISTRHPLQKKSDSSCINISINDITNNSYNNQYSFIFDKNTNEAKVSLKLEGNIFGGNEYHKEFILYFNIDATENIKKQIKIQPILNAINNVSLLEHSKLFVIKDDNPYYRLGEPVYEDKFHNLFLRFIDLGKEGQYNTQVIILSTILGVLISVLISFIFKIFLLFSHNNTK